MKYDVSLRICFPPLTTIHLFSKWIRTTNGGLNVQKDIVRPVQAERREKNTQRTEGVKITEIERSAHSKKGNRTIHKKERTVHTQKGRRVHTKKGRREQYTHRKEGEKRTYKERKLVDTLSPINHNGLHQG